MGRAWPPRAASSAFPGKTGYKIFERYEQCGLDGLSDRNRRPFRYANQLPEPVEAAIVAARARHLTGALAKSAIDCYAACRTPSKCRLPAPFTRSSIVMAW